MFALASQYTAGMNWLMILLGGAFCLLLTWCNLVLHEGEICKRKWYCVVQFLFVTAVTAVSARWTAQTWPTGTAFPVVPLALLLIAMFSVWHGAWRASGVGGVVFWMILLLFAIVLTAGIQSVKLQYLAPRLEEQGSPLFLVFLFPAVITFLPREGATCYTKTLLAALVLGLVLSVLTVGTLSSRMAVKDPFPFYTFSKSLSLLGVAERFEALVSVALTLGQFCLLSMLLGCAGHLAHTVQPGKGRAGVAVCAVSAASLMVFAGEIPPDWLGGGALLFWGILPLIFRNTVSAKKRKKS